MTHYKLLKELPGHDIGDILISSGGQFYMFESGLNYTMNREIVETMSDWFEEVFPNWVHGEECFFIAPNGMIINQYFDRSQHSTLVRFGNIFKTSQQAEEKLRLWKSTLNDTKSEY